MSRLLRRLLTRLLRWLVNEPAPAPEHCPAVIVPSDGSGAIFVSFDKSKVQISLAMKPGKA